MDSLEYFDMMISRERAARVKAGRSPVLDSDTIRLLSESARRKATAEQHRGTTITDLEEIVDRCCSGEVFHSSNCPKVRP